MGNKYKLSNGEEYTVERTFASKNTLVEQLKKAIESSNDCSQNGKR